MSEITQPAAPPPNLVLTAEEKKVFGQLFQAADTQNLGVITGELAVKFFEKSGLKPQVLGEIWGIADTENRGLLTKVGFSVALRLIGQAQSGQAPRPELAQYPGPLPTFKGVNPNWPAPGSPQQSSQAPQPPTSPIQQQLSGSGIAVPRLSPEDISRFNNLFENSGPLDGLLPGESARQIFQRAKLPNTTLGLIWGLADRQQRGALGPNEFVVAMHLIQCTMNGSLPALPNSLPQALFDAAGRGPRPATSEGRQRPSPVPSTRAVPPGVPTVPPIPRQFNPTRAQSPLRQQYTPPPMPPPTAAPPGPVEVPWAITALEKAKFDSHFQEVDTGNKGFITGEEAVPFFSGSKLPEEALAQIWDLADIEKNGSLTRDEFAIAMYLIRQERTRGTNGKGLPDTLPLNLIPLHIRPQLGFAAQAAPKPAGPSPFDAPAEQPKSNLDELFGLDDSFTTASSAQPSTTGAAPLNTAIANSSDGFSAPRSPLPAPQATSAIGLFGSTKPFVPSSAFGQNIISPSATGGTTSSKDTPSHLDDLLDPEVNKKLTSESTELANLSNQIGSLTKQTQDLKLKRMSADQNILNVANEKHGIELKLAQLRQSYENEERELKRVEELLATSRADTTRLRNDFVMLEATLTDLRNQKGQVQAAYDADVRENLSLKEKMKTTNQETNELRKQLEKLKLDARQQKGLVAINKKQLATSETERERVRSDIEREKTELAQSLSRGASPQPPASPTLSQTSTMSTNPFNANPFHRKSPPVQETASVEKRFQDSHGFFDSSPQSNFVTPVSNPGQNAFDNVFGSFTSPAGSGPPPPTSFSRQNTGNKEPTRSATFSAPSATESAFGGSTPPTSPPTSSYSSHTAEIPPSVASPHITSAFLPLTLNRTESATSSVQVQPPSESAFSRPETPTAWPGTIQESKPESETDAFRPSPLSHASTIEQEPKKLERTRTGSTTGGSPIAARNSDKRDSASDFGTAGSPISSHIPGSFPGIDIATPIKPTATGESYLSTMSNRSRVSQAKSEPLNFGFGAPEARGLQAAKDDFDAAFAGFGPTKLPERPATSKEEFPPIRELQGDDESDTASENGGFDDNFTSSSPKAIKTAGTAETAESQVSTLPIPESAVNKALVSNPSTPLPGPNSQASPPAYSPNTPGTTGDISAFPPEFTNLLPPRTDPTKTNTNVPPAQTAGTAKMFMSSPAMTPPASTSNVDSVFGPSVAPSSPPTTAAQPTSDYSAFSSVQSKPVTQSTAPKNSAFDDDDFESDFKDLGEAREANSKSDEYDNFATDHGYAEFNDVFDSPGAPKHVPTASVGSKNEDEFSAFQFNTLQATQPAQSNDDWDALFASLDKPGSSNQQSNGGGIGTANGGDSHAADTFGVNAPAALNTNLTGGKKVDPDVRKLQNMGFSEEQAATALKKFDNNLAEATNFLLDHPASPGPR
ncbi:hypothetical protein H072_5044 [Dactylellina haptotyla CBS 200.50]|uniref:Uncharacterized protein n=1 Tax=Dactylellina haptotyla (strain CBS 200.50) TaxID=1284197 RepID=S8AIT1_DACHA|nr:hypothetical protein H072_5044 [Dactylellina haptotyla CBS 200.50]